MATIKFEAGERFSCKKDGKQGFGIVLPNKQAFIISGEGGRTGYQVEKVKMLRDKSVLPLQIIPPHEVTFALECVALSHGLNFALARI